VLFFIEDLKDQICKQRNFFSGMQELIPYGGKSLKFANETHTKKIKESNKKIYTSLAIWLA